MQKKLQEKLLYVSTRMHLLFFCLFLASMTLSVRKVLFSYAIKGSFNEYTGIYLYVSDIFLILTFITFILCNINYILSIFRRSTTNFCSFFKKYYNHDPIVPRGTISIARKIYKKFVNNYLINFPIFLTVFSFISISWAYNKEIALFRAIKLAEYILLYLYIVVIVPRGTITDKLRTGLNSLTKQSKNQNIELRSSKQTTNCSTWNNFILFIKIAIAVGIVQSLIGISQFIHQQSIGLFWLKESHISPTIPGVAKLIINNHLLIRAYGLFPHPNIFGGYLVLSIFATLLIKKLYCSTWNNITCYSKVSIYNLFHVEQILSNEIFMRMILFIQGLALLLTFSKSAILGLIAGLFYIWTTESLLFVPRGTNFEISVLKKLKLFIERCKKSFNMFPMEHIKRKTVLISLILLFFTALTKPDMYSIFIKSLQEREFYLTISMQIIEKHPLLGTGAGQFVFQLLNISGVQNWQYQPVHNVFLLIFNELGFFALLGFVIFLFKILQLSDYLIKKGDIRSKIMIYLRSVLISYVFIMFFDHYLWDIQQGQFLFWILLGLITTITSDSLIVRQAV